jgi:hypothetical protein
VRARVGVVKHFKVIVVEDHILVTRHTRPRGTYAATYCRGRDAAWSWLRATAAITEEVLQTVRESHVPPGRVVEETVDRDGTSSRWR